MGSSSIAAMRAAVKPEMKSLVDIEKKSELRDDICHSWRISKKECFGVAELNARVE